MSVAHIHSDRLIPDASVFEVAVASAIAGRQDDTDSDIVARISDWYQRPVSSGDVAGAIDRLAERAWMVRGETFPACRLTQLGVENVGTLVGGSIRMLDRGLNLLNVSILMNFLNQTIKEANRDV